MADAAPQIEPVDKESVLAFLKSDHVDNILHLMPWETGEMARLFRASGTEIDSTTRDEQVYVFRWLLSLAAEHGDLWPSYAQRRIDAAKKMMAALAAAAAPPPPERTCP